jgi:hypothetical protein
MITRYWVEWKQSARLELLLQDVVVPSVLSGVEAASKAQIMPTGCSGSFCAKWSGSS